MVIGSLVTNIVADLSKWGPNLAKGRGQLASFVKSVGVLKASVGGLVATSGAMWFKQTVEQAGALKDQAASLNLTVEGMQRLRHASGQLGGNWNTLSRSVGMYNKIVGDAVRGNKSAIATLRSLGLEAKQLASMGTQSGILAAADAIRSLPQAEQASAARALFGRSGADNLGFFRNGSAAIQEQMNALTSMEVASGKMIDRLDEMADKLDRVKNAWQMVQLHAASAAVTIWDEMNKGPNAWPFNLWGPRAQGPPAIPANFPSTPAMNNPMIPASFPRMPALAPSTMTPAPNAHAAWQQQKDAARAMTMLNGEIAKLPAFIQGAIGQMRGQSLPAPVENLFRGIGGGVASWANWLQPNGERMGVSPGFRLTEAGTADSYRQRAAIARQNDSVQIAKKQLKQEEKQTTLLGKLVDAATSGGGALPANLFGS